VGEAFRRLAHCEDPGRLDLLKCHYSDLSVLTMMTPQIKAECIGCRENAAVFNMSYFGKFYLTGRDAQAAADYIFTNNVQLNPG